MAIEEDLPVLDAKMKQLRFDYEQYFLGSRPREPVMLRNEVQKLVTYWSNQAIQNTAHRFRFSSLCARFLCLKRQWDATLRKMEEGTYQRQVFRGRMQARPQGSEPPPPAAASQAGGADASAAPDRLYTDYVSACRKLGQDPGGLTAERMQRAMAQQRDAIRSRFGCRDVRFRVVVEDGRAKLKAAPGS